MQLESKAFQALCKSKGIDLVKMCSPLTKEGFPQQPTERYAHFIVLQQLEDFTIFTQDGQTILARDTSETIGSASKITRGVEFQRKPSAALRRKSMSILRTFAPKMVTLPSGSMTDIRAMEQFNPDASLFGFAVGEEGSKDGYAFCGKSRILTSSGFTIRPISEDVIQSINFSGQSDAIRIAEPSTALGEKEFFLPETVFPLIITVRNPTEADLIYISYVIDKCKRFGAVSSRSGKVTMHLLGIAFSNEELPSNLEMSQAIYAKLGKPNTLPAMTDLKIKTLEVLTELCTGQNIHFTMLNGNDVTNAFYSDILKTDVNQEKWLLGYCTIYKKILTQLDVENAPDQKKATKRKEEVDAIVKECDKILASL